MNPIDITAAVHKRGTTLAALARHHRLSTSALNYAVYHPAKRSEAIIAEFLGLPPQKLWPDRYDAHGNRLVRMKSAKPSKRSSAHRRMKGQ